MGTFLCDRCKKVWPDLAFFCCSRCRPRWSSIQFWFMLIVGFGVFPFVIFAPVVLFVVWLYS